MIKSGKAPLVVYYNTLCPVCDAGINRQKSKMLPLVKSGNIAFRDINQEPDKLAAFGATLEGIRKKLHAVKPDGTLLVGVDVAFEIWRQTPGEKWVAILLGNPLFRPFSRIGYDVIAHFLYKWNEKKGHW